MTLKIEIDRDECTQCGLCYEDECPSVFVEGDDGTSTIKEEYQAGGPDKGEVPDDLEECVNNAADSCPVDAISVSKD